MNSKLNLEKDIRQKIAKRETILSIAEQFDKEGYVSFLSQEVQGEDERVAQYDDFIKELTESVVDEQKLYAGFEKAYFLDLEKCVIDRKQANIQKIQNLVSKGIKLAQ